MNHDKPDYKNWMPKGMILSFTAGTALCALICGLAKVLMIRSTLRTVIVLILLVMTILLLSVTIWCIVLYKAFDYHGRRQMARQIIQGVAGYIKLKEGQTGLDVGCGSGALTIACAKGNPEAMMVGLDRWGREYASFNKSLCERNARIEGVAARTKFVQGDACKLPFPNECFDAVSSNYVYHNIPVRDRRELLRESLRCLKKGGTFAIHDIFSVGKYIDIQKFAQELKDSGYEKVELIDTTKGMFMSRQEAVFMGLSGSALLCGKK